MRKTLVAATAVGILVAPAAGVAFAQSAEPATVTGNEGFSSDANQPSYWGENCTKIEDFDGEDTMFVLPAGITFTQVIVKAAGPNVDPYTNTIFGEPPVSGEFVWADTNGNKAYDPGGKDGDKGISHVIWCGEPAETPTPTPTPTPPA